MSDTITTTEDKTTTTTRPDKGRRSALGTSDEGRKSRKGPVVFGSVILILLAGVGLVLGGRALVDTINYVSTDDAAIDADHVDVSSTALGRISTMLAEEGDKVGSGQVLALLDETDLRAQAAQASASLVSARRNVALSRINLEGARSDADRARTLFASGAVTKEQNDHAANALDAASAQYAIALAQVDTVGAQLGVIENRLLDTKISSPMAGVVAKKDMMQGDVVQPGQAIYTINDLDRIWITANFEETKLARIELGAPVIVRVDAYKGTFTGKVALIGVGIVEPPFSIGDFTKTTRRVPVRIALDKGQTGLIPGLSVEVKVKTKALFKLPFGGEAGT